MERIARRLAHGFGRSLIPILALILILGTLWWGPWITLLAAAVLWYTIGHVV